MSSNVGSLFKPYPVRCSLDGAEIVDEEDFVEEITIKRFSTWHSKDELNSCKRLSIAHDGGQSSVTFRGLLKEEE